MSEREPIHLNNKDEQIDSRESVEANQFDSPQHLGQEPISGKPMDEKIDEGLSEVRQRIDQEISSITKEPSVPDHGTSQFDIEGTEVSLDWHRYNPKILTKEREFKEDTGVIFLPGWSSSPDSKSTLPLIHGFAQQITKDSGSFVLSIDTRANRIVEDSLFVEAEAIRRYIADHDIKEVVLAGHSQGGDQAINLAALLEQYNPEIKVDGLILLDAVGLYKQGKFELFQKFLRDEWRSLIGTRFSKRIRQAEGDILAGIGKELSRSKLLYLKRLKNEIADMAKKNPRAEKVKCPVILVQGKDDLISSPDKIKRTASEHANKLDSISELDPREALLRGLFPQSPHVRLVQATNQGNHFVPLQRAETVAAASLYLLRRFQRSE